MNHVPYKGAAPAFVDLIAGNVDLMFANVVGALPHIKSGRLRVVAVSAGEARAGARERAERCGNLFRTST